MGLLFFLTFRCLLFSCSVYVLGVIVLTSVPCQFLCSDIP